MQWDGIDEFIHVVQAGSFSKAAELLGLSNSQVSKRVAKLEARLGARLIYRTTRRLSLTEEGRSYYQHCLKAHEHLSAAEASLSEETSLNGILRLNLAGAFQERYIVDLLAAFMQLHPQLEIALSFSDRRTDLIASGYDLAICQGPLEDSGMGGKRLASMQQSVVASPAYLKRVSTPATPQQLEQHNCLIGTDNHWHFDKNAQSSKVRVKGNWRSENAHALLAASRAGIGLAQLPHFSVEDDIASGRLIQVLKDYSQLASDIWAVYPDPRYIPVRVRRFIAFIEQQWSVET